MYELEVSFKSESHYKGSNEEHLIVDHQYHPLSFNQATESFNNNSNWILMKQSATSQ